MIDFELLEDNPELDLELDEEDETVEAEFEELFEKEVNGTTDYEKLKNLPSLDGETIKGNIQEKDPTVPDWAKSERKPSYTAAETGSVPDDGGIPLAEIATWFD